MTARLQLIILSSCEKSQIGLIYNAECRRMFQIGEWRLRIAGAPHSGLYGVLTEAASASGPVTAADPFRSRFVCFGSGTRLY